jgi:alanyl-tRNA synthetase
MKTDELRERYLSFFESKGCVRRPSDVLVPNDPTVLFTPAGMNQFKNEFLGTVPLTFTKATTCQKCIRTGDISNVGVTPRHHTFFEMLGNFSFGDYFKREAIHWAWEFLTDKKWLGLEPERLTITVYLDDDEAYNIWANEIKVPTTRITRENEYENFWPAGAPTDGPDGVCGPCSEIYYLTPGSTQPVEIWNLVFTQFNRVGAPPNNLQPLPAKNIDTGMGLERTAAAMQQVASNFEIDTLKPLCQFVGEVIGKKYEFTAEYGRAMRRIADHVRAVNMCVHEGVLPGNEKQGYIVRQLLRRASLEGFLLGKKVPFLHLLVPKVVEMLAVPYPDLKQTINVVQDAIKSDEEQFLDTVDRGLNRFQRIAQEAKKGSKNQISGKEAFDMHQTDGFFVELTEALAQQEGLTVDKEEFKVCMDQHKLDSGKGAFVDAVMIAGPIDEVRKKHGGTKFVGYETTSTTSEIIGIVAQSQLAKTINADSGQVVMLLEQSPFYAESGGQVGDTGVISTNGNAKFIVEDTQKDGELWVHIGRVTAGELKVGDKVTATVDADRRQGIRRAHSATHILHHALHTVLGDKAVQRGSKVESDKLRFDFAHGQTITDLELQQIEDIVNTEIATGAVIDTRVLPIEEAKKLGAMALFGEKYPDFVRVVVMGDFSKEFCGGTHLTNSGQVGLCKITAESLVAKGVHRIEALTGQKALQRIRDLEKLVRDLQILTKAPRPEDLAHKISQFQSELKAAQEKINEANKQSIAGSIDQLLASAKDVNGVPVICTEIPGADKDALRECVDQIRAKAKSVAILLISQSDDKVNLIAAVSKDLIAKGIKAGDCVKVAAACVKGGGGGRPDLAEAGGKDPAGIPEAIKVATEFYTGKL